MTGTHMARGLVVGDAEVRMSKSKTRQPEIDRRGREM